MSNKVQGLIWDIEFPNAMAKIIALKLADMAVRVEAARLLTDKAAAALDRGDRSDYEAGMAKLFATEELGKALDELLQLYGGYGYMMEYPITRAFVDSRVTRIYGGTSEVMKELISRSL